MRPCILVLAREAAIRATLARTLTPLGFSVELASSEKTARQLTSKQRFTAAIMTVRSAAADDVALIHEFRSAADKLVLLAGDAGTAERLARSFPEALVCSSQRLEHERVCAFLSALGRKESTPAANGPEFLRFAGRTLDVAGCIFIDAEGREVPLTRGEFALLVAFARNCGRVLSRARLRNAMDGGGAESYDRSIDMLVARLRRKIEPHPTKPQFIVTVPGVGYKFTPHVRRGQPTTASLASQDTDEALGASEAPRAERRQVTVLSCQILGLAALAAKLDPEDLDRAIGPVHAACAETIARHKGTVVRTLGDGVLAYFGYPTAEENDAPRAVRAALELLRAIRAMEAPPIGNFHARIGVATGLMLVGELTSMGARDAGGWGEALNLALHLERAAPHDGVVIAAATRSLIGRLFECRQLDPVELQEGLEPVPAWHVIDEIAGMPRFEALRRASMQGFVGREAEIERLRQCWSKALRGSGQVVLVTGEAGIGKSRLAVELEERICGELHAVVRYSGSPHRADAPMSALSDELQRSAGFAANDSPAQKVEKLRAEFGPLGPGATEAAALACAVLGLPFEASPQVNQTSPQKRKELTFAALLARLEAKAARQPVVAVAEDVHWVDPTSLEFITMLVERASAMPLLLVIVARPGFLPPWPEHSHVTALALSRLSHANSVRLIERLAGERRIENSIQEAIVARADGVPLFVEELTKSLLEARAGDDDRAIRASAVASVSIPTTLYGLLLTRFDRLDRGKEVAQLGAVIGREFSFELLRIVTGLGEPVLHAALNQLVTSGLVFRRGSPPEATFVFKHALVRDAAYGMLPRERRQILHAGVARAYEENLPEIVRLQPELLAFHWSEGGAPDKAVSYLLTAADRALHRSATTEALSHLVQARDLISHQPENRHRLQLELTLELTSARALLATRGYTAIETRQAYRRARERCEALGDQSSLPLIIHGQWLSAWIAADHQLALEEARRLDFWGERNQDRVGRAMGHADIGMTLTTLGRLADARRHLDQALQINSFVLPGRQPFVASDVDGRISALSFKQNCLLLLGLPDQAEAAAKEATSLCRENLYSNALAQTRTLRMRVFEGNAPAAAEIGHALLRLCQEQGYPHFIGTAMVYSGWAMAQCGDPAGGITTSERGLAQLQAIGAKCWLPLHLALLAECYDRAGDRDRAAEAVAQALESVETTGERIWESEIYRLKGKLLLYDSDDVAQAADCFVTALSKARSRQSKLLELRAATSMARLWRDQGQREKARELLAAVYGWFTEGFDTLDLRQAKALLDSLGT